MENFFEEEFKLNGVNKVELSKKQKRKLIGLLFAIYLKVKNKNPYDDRYLKELIKKNKISFILSREKNNYVFFVKPSDLGKFAGLIGFSGKRNPNNLKELLRLLNFESINVRAKYKSTHLLITNIKDFIRNFDYYKVRYKTKYNNQKIKNLNDINDIINEFFNKSFRSVPKKLVNYFDLFEFRFHREADYFNLKKVRGIPFLRIHYGFHFANNRFLVPRNFINYNHLLNLIFYNFPFSQIHKNHFEIKQHSVPKNSIDKTFNELLELFKEHNFKLLNQQTYNDEFWKVKHFKQIIDAYPIVRQISENGITIDNLRATKILKELEYSLSKNKDNNKTRTLEKLYYKIKKYLDDKEKRSLNNPFMDYFWGDDKIAISEEENDELLTDNLDELSNNYSYVLTAYRMGIYSTLDKNSKIYGHFTTHGASSHRMTCKKFNLQSMNKELRKLLFRPINENNRILLSADVSGQDIIVAVSLAERYYKSISDQNNLKKCKELIDYIKKVTTKHSTGNEISGTSSGEKGSLTVELAKLAFDKLLELLLEQKIITDKEDISTYDLLGILSLIKINNKPNYETIKPLIKEYIYTNFYGGSANTIKKDRKNKFKKILQELDKYLNEIDLNKFNKEEKEVFVNYLLLLKSFCKFYEVNTKNKFRKLYEIENLYIGSNRNYDDQNEDSSITIKKIATLTKDFNKSMLDLVLKSIKKENDEKSKGNFPEELSKFSSIIIEKDFISILLTALLIGIIKDVMSAHFEIIFTFLNDAQNYYFKNNKTLSTLLDWQTLIIGPKVNKSDKITRSKSYPVQASGAELMRQWLIEINKLGKGKNFSIINTIHDQVLIDCLESEENSVREILNESIRKAAGKLKIDPDIVAIQIERVYPSEN